MLSMESVCLVHSHKSSASVEKRMGESVCFLIYAVVSSHRKCTWKFSARKAEHASKQGLQNGNVGSGSLHMYAVRTGCSMVRLKGRFCKIFVEVRNSAHEDCAGQKKGENSCQKHIFVHRGRQCWFFRVMGS